VSQRQATIVLTGLLAVGMLTGCRREEGIRVYQAPKEPMQTLPAVNKVPAQMLAAMVIRDGKAWYFKVLGPQTAIAPHEAAFHRFLESVRFEGDNPTWTLPDGWQARPGSDTRFATIVLGEGAAPQLSVIPLGIPPQMAENIEQYVLANVNRWRRQVSLPPIDQAELDKQAVRMEVDGAQATIVSLKGVVGSDGVHAPPSIGGSATGPNPHRPAAPLTFDVPDGWQRQPPTPGALVTFTAGAEAAATTITITALGGDGGGLLPNVNRWRRQLQLEPLEEDELDAALQAVTVDGQAAHLVELLGPEDGEPRRAMLGAIVPIDGQTWFFKLTGEAASAEREKARFRAFVQSVQFTASNGTEHGE